MADEERLSALRERIASVVKSDLVDKIPSTPVSVKSPINSLPASLYSLTTDITDPSQTRQDTPLPLEAQAVVEAKTTPDTPAAIEEFEFDESSEYEAPQSSVFSFFRNWSLLRRDTSKKPEETLQLIFDKKYVRPKTVTPEPDTSPGTANSEESFEILDDKLSGSDLWNDSEDEDDVFHSIRATPP